MVEADAGDGRGERLAGRDRVEPAAQARLEHRELDALLGEGQKAEHRGDLEVGQRHARGRDARVERRQAIAVDLDAAPRGCAR